MRSSARRAVEVGQILPVGSLRVYFDLGSVRNTDRGAQPFFLSSAMSTWAAARRAIGTRNGEQDT